MELLFLSILGFALLILYGMNLVARFQHRHLPGPKPALFVGNLPHLGGPTKSYLTLSQWAKTYGPIYVWYLGRIPSVMLTDPDLIREVALKKFTYFHDRPAPALLFGSKYDLEFMTVGMLFARGKYWGGLRAACEPLFHQRALNTYAHDINEAAAAMISGIKKAIYSSSPSSSININHAFALMTMDVIGKTAFGVEFDAQKTDDKPNELLSAAQIQFRPFAGLGRVLTLLVFAFPSLKHPLYELTYRLKMGGMDQVQSSRRFLWSVAQVLLNNSRAASPQSPTTGPATAPPTSHQTSNINTGSVHNIAPPGCEPEYRRAEALYGDTVPAKTSLVYKLRNATHQDTGKPLSDLDICAQSFTFLLAGYETTSLALSFTLYELSKSPAVLKKVQEEVDALGLTPGQEIRYEDLSRLPYTEAVFLEGMRMWPPVNTIIALSRESRGAMVCGHWLPPGGRVMFNIWALHHDPIHFPQPEEFRPERFVRDSPEALERHPYAYIPFGMGPRKCAGQKLAMEEGVLVLARMVQAFEFKLDEEKHTGPLVLGAGVTLVPVDGIWMKFKYRS